MRRNTGNQDPQQHRKLSPVRVAVIAAIATAAAACSSPNKQSATPTTESAPATAAPQAVPGRAMAPVGAETSTSSTQPSTTTTTISERDAVTAYIGSADRNQAIATAVHSFGQKVIMASRGRNAWSPFDAYCSDPADMAGASGWKSQGFKPKSGDVCAVQHNPQYGGENMQVDATVQVGPNGQYTDTFTGAGINTDSCVGVHADLMQGTSEWDISIGFAPNATQSTGTSQTLAVAKQLDAEALACFNGATYK